MEVGDSVKSIDMEASYRDGLFEDEQLFMVYAKDDTKKLVDLLTQALNMDVYK